MSLNGNVSNMSITYMVISLVLSTILPLGVIIYLGVKKRLNVKALLFGVLLFVVFALVLEQLLHLAVFGMNATQSFIYKTPVLFALYGGFAAGIFEETARLIGFKFLIRVRENESINTGISYGLGHGGIEAVLIGGLTTISNLMASVMINSGAMEKMFATLPAASLESSLKMCNTLISTPSYLFLVSGIERTIALVLQISLSLFVLKAVTEKRWEFFFGAILIHAAVDIPAALYQAKTIQNVLIVEIIVLVFSVSCALAAYKLYHGKKEPELADGGTIGSGK